MVVRFKECLLAACLGSFIAWVPTAPLAAMSLAQAIERAIGDDPGLAAAHFARGGHEALVDAARGGHFPSLTASSQIGYRQLETAAGSESLQTSRQAFALRQSIYAGGGVSAALSAAKSRAAASSDDLALNRQDTILAVVEAYLSVLRDQALLDLAIASEQRLGAYAQSVRQRYRFGAITAGDVALADARSAAAAAATRQAAGALNVSGAAFKERVGAPPGELLVPNLPSGLPPTLDDALLSIETHPALEQAQHIADAAGFDVGVAKAAMRPRLSLDGDAALVDAPEETTSGRQDMSISLNLVVPIYQGGIADARHRAATLEAARQERLIERERRSLETAIVSAWERLQAGLDGNAALASEVAAATLARDSFEQEVLAGQRSLLDVIDAETDLLASQTKAVTGRLASITDAFRVLAATGALTE